MKHVLDLDFGFSDAENYKRSENRDLFNKFFIRTYQLDELCEHGVSFLVGEKGTGKTAYAVYLSNNSYKETRSSIRYIRETEYQKFVSLKKEKQLELSDYSSIWKVILYLLMSQQVLEREGGIDFLKKFKKFDALQKAIDEYYNNAFSPEIVQAMQFVQESKMSAELIAKHAEATGESGKKMTFSESRFQMNLFYIQKQFESALSQARLSWNHILFIDGIDIRPSSIPYDDYLDSIKGLANAVWELNNDFFPTIKGGRGRMKVVLLVRPDIFQSLGLQNQNTKIRDNAVFLSWITDYKNYRTSNLFQVIDHLLASQQDKSLRPGEAWDYYFPWHTQKMNKEKGNDPSFVSFLRLSYYRPRDIITMLIYLQDLARTRGIGTGRFSLEDIQDPEFLRLYSDYLLGEIKDHLMFYYGLSQYEDIFLTFFQHLQRYGGTLSHENYLAAFEKYIESPAIKGRELPMFMNNASTFLQFLYDLNIVGCVTKPVDDQAGEWIHWCYRERKYSNISPKVREGAKYRVFYGLRKALNVGKRFK